MMVTLKVMTYFKVSLATHNWDRAFFKHFLPADYPGISQEKIKQRIGGDG
ncbi:hypothetical protein ACTG13_05365 [Aeromonas hydrophila]